MKTDSYGRNGRIRTADLRVPNAARYQAALHSVTSDVTKIRIIPNAARFLRCANPRNYQGLLYPVYAIILS